MKLRNISIFFILAFNLNSESFLVKINKEHASNIVEEIIFENGWSKSGINQETGTIYDSEGWTQDGVNKDTGTKYDSSGYDREGFDNQGLSQKYTVYEEGSIVNSYSTRYYAIQGYEYQTGGSPAQRDSVAFYGSVLAITNPENGQRINFTVYGLKPYSTRTLIDSATGEQYKIKTLGTKRSFVYGTQNQDGQSYNVYKHVGEIEYQKYKQN